MKEGCLLDVSTDDLMELISHSVLFSALDRKGRTGLLHEGKVEIYEDKEIVVREGDPGDSFYLIISGAIDVSTENDGEPMHLASIDCGNFFGEMSVFQNTPRSANCTAVGETTLICFTKEVISGVLTDHPEAQAMILNKMVEREEDNYAKSLDHLLGLGSEENFPDETKKPGDDFDIF